MTPLPPLLRKHCKDLKKQILIADFEAYRKICKDFEQPFKLERTDKEKYLQHKYYAYLDTNLNGSNTGTRSLYITKIYL